jgi:hypothetical protein
MCGSQFLHQSLPKMHLLQRCKPRKGEIEPPTPRQPRSRVARTLHGESHHRRAGVVVCGRVLGAEWVLGVPCLRKQPTVSDGVAQARRMGTREQQAVRAM